MSDYTTSRATRYLPQVLVATAAVAVLPVVIVWWLRAQGVVSSSWVCLVLAMALSLGISLIGSAYWKRRRGSGDLFFSEVLLWGWLRRLRVERQLSKAVEVLRLERGGELALDDQASVDQRAQLIRQLAAALDAQDPYTDGHSRRVARHAAMVARKLGLASGEVARIQAAAAVHDVGKLRIPPEVLNKPDKLTPEEFAVAKRHAEQGALIVACLGDPALTEIVRHHHERFDGGGYPSGLAGEAIPLGARVVAVADTFDAMTSVRPYRLAAPHKEAMEALEVASGSQLDPAVVRAFLRCYSSNKLTLFWALLAVSPQRAFALLRGKSPSVGNASLGSIVASTTAVAAIGAAALTAPFGGGTPRYELSASRSPAPQSAAAPIVHRAATRDPHAPTHVVPAARRVRSAAPVRHSHSAGITPTGGARPARRSVSGTSRKQGGGSGAGPSHGAGGKPGSGSGGKPGGGSGGKPGGGSPGGTTSPGGSSGSGSVSGTTGGTPPGSPAGGGSGSGTGTGAPATKDECKNGGWASYPQFTNQGQCVSSVEPPSN